jgi:hypothetical protein
MGIPGRFRDPIAFVEATAFGAFGVVAASLGPWEWLAWPAGPVIFVVVLLVSARPRPASPKPPEDIIGIVRYWAGQLTDDDPVRPQADRVVDVAGAIEALTLQCELMVAKIDDAVDQRKVRENLRMITDYVSKRVNPDVDAPRRAPEWNALERYLQITQDELEGLLHRP